MLLFLLIIPFVSLQPTKTRAELDSLTVLYLKQIFYKYHPLNYLSNFKGIFLPMLTRTLQSLFVCTREAYNM